MKQLILFLTGFALFTASYAQSNTLKPKSPSTPCPCFSAPKSKHALPKKKPSFIKVQEEKSYFDYQLSNQNSFNNSYIYNNYSYIYYLPTPKTDTVKIIVEKTTPIHGILGASINSMPELGIWGTIGQDFYAIGEINYGYTPYKKEYYSIKYWGYDDDDKRHRTEHISYYETQSYKKSFLIGVGVGKYVTKNIGLHVEYGFGTTNFSSPYNKTYNVNTVKIGAIGKLSKKLSLKVDYDFNRQVVGAGLGVNL